MKKLREDMDGNSEKIDQVDIQLKQIANDLQEIEQWVADEEQEERLMRKKEIESDIERRSDWRSLWIAIISTGLGGAITLIAQYLFF
jgi:septal ring factor EnvC (AmiA/AmiB activator)